jgi:hypothetical protein
LVEKQSASREKTEEKRRAREMEFVHPSLLGGDANNNGSNDDGTKVGNVAAGGSGNAGDGKRAGGDDVERLVNKFVKKGNGVKKRKSLVDEDTNGMGSDMIAGFDVTTKKKEKKSRK